MLSLFLQDETFTDDLIMDEVARPIFAAGIGTTQYAAQSVMSHLVRSPTSLEKVREEYRALALKHPEANEIGNRCKNKHDVMKEVLTLDGLQDLDYLSWVMMEALRFQAPSTQTSWLTMTQDTKIGKITFKQGDIFNIDFRALHFDSVQWQKP